MILEFAAADVAPQKRAVLQSLGIPPDVTVPERIEELYARGFQLLEETTAPVGSHRRYLDRGVRSRVRWRGSQRS